MHSRSIAEGLMFEGVGKHINHKKPKAVEESMDTLYWLFKILNDEIITM